jgi:hypothetical protein
MDTDRTDIEMRAIQAVRIVKHCVPIALRWNDEKLAAYVESAEFPKRVRACLDRIFAGEKLTLPQIATAIDIPFAIFDAGYRCELAELGIDQPARPMGEAVH